MGALLVYSEHRDTALELVAGGRGLAVELGLELRAACLGGEAAAWAAEVAAHGAAQVFTSADPALDGLATDVVADALAQLVAQTGATVVLLGSTRRGRELGGRLAQKLGAACVTDATSASVEDGRLVAGRYSLGGATVQRESLPLPAVVAVMPKIFAVDASGATAGAVVPATLSLQPSSVRVVERRPREGEAVDLAAALRIVGVGRGFSKREDLPLGESLAAAFGGELACTKSLADFGWLPEDRIVGLSGAKTAPDVYLAVGVSGQVQHTVGISQAKVIAVVNTDKEAPIFALADYGIVADLYQVVPALIEKLKAV
jgi:electron transfer flavoprotein alpha subunit